MKSYISGLRFSRDIKKLKMRNGNKSLSKVCVLVMLILLISISSLESCKPKPELIPVGEARVIGMLPNGNWEVTPAFLIWVADLKKALEECRKEKEK